MWMWNKNMSSNEMYIHLFVTAMMEAALMVIGNDKNNSLSYWVFISIIRQTYLYRSFFDVLLTVHLSIILVINQLNAQILVL